MKSLIILFFAGVVGLSATGADAADLAALMVGCNGCHGDQGVSQNTDIPTIAGLAGFVHSDALFAYKAKARPCATGQYRHGDLTRKATDMCSVAMALSEAEIEAVAEAYAGLPYIPAVQPFDKGLAATGKAVHEQHCDRCHSDGGTNPDDEAGMLGGQWMGYLETSFAEFAAGTREQPRKMKEKMDLLSKDEVKALLHYYAGYR